MAPLLDERARRLWAAAESIAIGYGGDALISAATGLARETIRNGRRELAAGVLVAGRIRRPGAGRPGIEAAQPGLTAAVERLVEPLTRGDPTSPLRWTCKSKAKLAAALTAQGWRVSATTVGRVLHALGYRLQALRKTQEGATHPMERAIRTHQCHGDRVPRSATTGHLGGNQEEKNWSGSSCKDDSKSAAISYGSRALVAVGWISPSDDPYVWKCILESRSSLAWRPSGEAADSAT